MTVHASLPAWPLPSALSPNRYAVGSGTSSPSAASGETDCGSARLRRTAAARTEPTRRDEPPHGASRPTREARVGSKSARGVALHALPTLRGDEELHRRADACRAALVGTAQDPPRPTDRAHRRGSDPPARMLTAAAVVVLGRGRDLADVVLRRARDSVSRCSTRSLHGSLPTEGKARTSSCAREN